jgi:hypothetical protein
MKRPLTPARRAAATVGFLALLVGCGSSAAKSGAGTTSVPMNVQLIASQRAATDLVAACLHGDTTHVLSHVESHLRSAQWANACKAFRDHHMKLVSAQTEVHGDKATVHVRLKTHDSHPQDFDEAWDLSYHGHGGWQLATMPAVMVGTWDDHNNTSTTVHHDDDHNSTTVHHGDDHHNSTSTTVHHGDDHHNSTSTTVHHDDDHNSTSTTVHHDDDHTGTTAHHDEGDD